MLKIPALTLALLISFCAAPSRSESVQPLQSAGDTFCTAFSIDEAAGYWATAAHCAAYALQEQLAVTIAGQPAWVVSIAFPSADVAVLQSDAHATAFRLAKDAPEVGDEILVIGYPYGITRTQTFGRMAARRIPILHPSTGYYMTSDILDITTAGGNSGSPVFNHDGDVVGVLWGGFTESAHSLSVPLESLRWSLGPYWSVN